MTIFISHNSKDKHLIEPIAEELAVTFGENQVFYDSWSIKPGEGIVERMNQGIADCKVFAFFISAHSLNSAAVSLEWQAAVVKRMKGDCLFVPVLMDDSLLPPIILESSGFLRNSNIID